MINAVQPRAVQPVGRCGIPANCTHPGRVLLARSSTIVPFAREEPPRYIRSVGRGVSKSRGVAAIELSTAMSLYSSPGLRSQPGWLRRPAGRPAAKLCVLDRQPARLAVSGRDAEPQPQATMHAYKGLRASTPPPWSLSHCRYSCAGGRGRHCFTQHKAAAAQAMHPRRSSRNWPRSNHDGG